MQVDGLGVRPRSGLDPARSTADPEGASALGGVASSDATATRWVTMAVTATEAGEGPAPFRIQEAWPSLRLRPAAALPWLPCSDRGSGRLSRLLLQDSSSVPGREISREGRREGC